MGRGHPGGGSEGGRGGGRKPFLPSLFCSLEALEPPTNHLQVEGIRVYQGNYFIIRDQYWSRGEASSCEEVGRRIGSLCAIEVEGLKRRPPTVGGRPLPWVWGLGFGVGV